MSIVFTTPISAHVSGQPPFFRVNGTFSNYYPVPFASYKFEIPQDIAPQNYILGEKINFEIDTTALAQTVPPEIIKKTTFSWDFGDGEKAKGLANPHAYKKAGAYILKISAKYEEIAGDQLIQSILVNVIPDKNYELPKPIINVNDKTSRDPLVDIQFIPFGQKLNLDATASEAKSSPIVEYLWDFGDSQTANGSKQSHTYSVNLAQQQVFPVLRVIDGNGFFADSYVQITNSKGDNNINSTSSSTIKKTVESSQPYLLIWGACVLLIIATAVLKLKKKK